MSPMSDQVFSSFSNTFGPFRQASFSSTRWQTPADEAADFLTTWFGPPTPFPTQSVNFEKLWQVVRDADGAAGCDGWSASELRYLPLSAIRLWHDLGTRWLVAEQVPQQLTQVRQVNLAKSHKIDNQSCG